MTAITRRDAIALTTAAAAMAPSLAAAADEPKASITVADGVLDGSSIPIGVIIPRAALDAAKGTGALTVTLHAFPVGKAIGDANDKTLFQLTVQPAALVGNVSFATRLQILTDITDAKTPPITTDHPAKAALQIDVAQGGTKIMSAEATNITIGFGNCPPADSSTLRMSVQPGQTKANTQITIKALAPRPRPVDAHGISARHVKQIDLTSNGAKMLSVSSDTEPYWSDETYFAFSYQQPDVPADLVAMWNYDDKMHPLQTTMFLAADP